MQHQPAYFLDNVHDTPAAFEICTMTFAMSTVSNEHHAAPRCKKVSACRIAGLGYKPRLLQNQLVG